MIQQLLPQARTSEVSTWISNVLAAYLRKDGVEPIDLGEAEHIIDFLNSPAAPTRLRRMSVEQARKSAEQWTRSLQKHGRNIGETEADTEVVLQLRNDMRLVRLVGEAAFKREGYLMRHCVGSYVGKEGSDVYSIRDANNEPHCTIEVVRQSGSLSTDGSINQVKGKGNGPIHPKYIDAVLMSLMHFGMEIRESELDNLGYIRLTDQLRDFLDSNGFLYKTLTFGGQVYIYKHGKMETTK